MPHTCSQTQLHCKNDQRMTAAGDKMEDVTESERGIIREPLILGHPSPLSPVILLPLSSPDLQNSPSLLHFIPLPRGHNSGEHSCVSGCRPPRFHRVENWPQGQEQKVSTSSVSCHVMYYWPQYARRSAHIWIFVWVSATESQWCKPNLKCHLFSYNPSGFPVMKQLWQQSINEAWVNSWEMPSSILGLCVNRKNTVFFLQ